MLPRVVVSGIGMVTPLGKDVPSTWSQLVDGKVAVRKLETSSSYAHLFPPSLIQSLPCRVVASVDDRFNDDLTSTVREDRLHQEKKELNKSVRFAATATLEALSMAGFQRLDTGDPEERVSFDLDHFRTGVIVGSGMSSLESLSSADSLIKDGVRSFSESFDPRISPYFIPQILINLISGYISKRHQILGPIGSSVLACATGSDAILQAYRVIRLGEADVMVCGGTEASIHPLCFGGFSKMRALSTHFNDTPEQASRPFDRLRDGFVIGEGAGILILESLESALTRSAPILAELVGGSSVGEGFHWSRPQENGDGAARSIQQALLNSRTDPSEIEYVNAHATSTPLGDAAEASAVARIFGNCPRKVLVSSIKGATGHLLGAAGAIEAGVSILAIKHQTAPPTANLQDPDTDPAIEYVMNYGKKTLIRTVMSNSFGFGGANTSLVFREFEKNK